MVINCPKREMPFLVHQRSSPPSQHHQCRCPNCCGYSNFQQYLQRPMPLSLLSSPHPSPSTIQSRQIYPNKMNNQQLRQHFKLHKFSRRATPQNVQMNFNKKTVIEKKEGEDEAQIGMMTTTNNNKEDLQITKKSDTPIVYNISPIYYNYSIHVKR